MKLNKLSPSLIRNDIQSLKSKTENIGIINYKTTADEKLGSIIRIDENFYWLDSHSTQVCTTYLLDEKTGRLKHDALPTLLQQNTSTLPSVLPGYTRYTNFDINGKPYDFFELSPSNLVDDLNLLEENSQTSEKPYTGGQIFKVFSPSRKEHSYYWIEKNPFASGNFGNICDAYQLGTEKDSAGKIIKVEADLKNPWVAKTFKNENGEAPTTETEYLFLKQAGIKVIKPERNDILIMENLGSTLGNFFQTEDFQTLNFEDRIEIFWQISLHLYQIHHTTKKGKAFIHGDIKSENILIHFYMNEKGKYQIKTSIADMGSGVKVTQNNEDDDPNTIQIGRAECTLTNLAPETVQPVLRDDKLRVTLKSDIYSLLPVFLELFGVKDPFSKKKGLIRECNKLKARYERLPVIESGTEEEKLASDYNNKLSQLVNTPYSFEGIFQEIDVSFIPTHVIAILTQFLKRISEKEIAKRPDSEELLFFSTALKNLFHLKKTGEENSASELTGKENHYLAQLILISQGLWLKPMSECVLGKSIFFQKKSDFSSTTLGKFFQQTDFSPDRERLEEAIVLLNKAGWVDPAAYTSPIDVPADQAHFMSAPTPPPLILDDATPSIGHSRSSLNMERLTDKERENLQFNLSKETASDFPRSLLQKEHLNSLAIKGIIILLQCLPEEYRIYIVNYLIEKLMDDFNLSNKKFSLWERFVNWITPHHKKPTTIVRTQVTTAELVELAILSPENSYFLERLMENDHVENLLNNKEELLKQLISSRDEYIFDKLRHHSKCKEKIQEITRKLITPEEDISDVMGYIPIVKDDFLKKIFYLSINDEKKIWTENEKKIFHAISEEKNETLKNSFSNQIQGADNVLKFYLLLLDNPENRIFIIQGKKIDITTFFLSVDRFIKILDIIPEKKESLRNKLKNIGKEKKLTAFDEEILTKMHSPLAQHKLPKHYSSPLHQFSSRVNNGISKKAVYENLLKPIPHPPGMTP